MSTNELLQVCRCLLADLEGAIEMYGDNYPDCWRQSVSEAHTLLEDEKCRG